MATRRLSCRLSLLACSTLHRQPTPAQSPALPLALAHAVRCYATQPQQTIILPDGPTASTPSFSADPTTPASTPPRASSSSASRLPPLAPEPVPKIEPSPLLTRVQRPIGALRGGLIGFLLGMTTVGIWGYTHLLQDYMTASKALLDSVQELHVSTEKMTSHIERIEAVEKTVNDLSKSSSTNEQIDTLRNEYRKLLQAEHLEVLALKSHVWGMQVRLPFIHEMLQGDELTRPILARRLPTENKICKPCQEAPLRPSEFRRKIMYTLFVENHTA